MTQISQDLQRMKWREAKKKTRAKKSKLGLLQREAWWFDEDNDDIRSFIKDKNDTRIKLREKEDGSN